MWEEDTRAPVIEGTRGTDGLVTQGTADTDATSTR